MSKMFPNEPRILQNPVHIGNAANTAHRDVMAGLVGLLEQAFINKWKNVSHSIVDIGMDGDKRVLLVTVTGMAPFGSKLGRLGS